MTGVSTVELDERGIPAAMLPQARAWFAEQVRQLESTHGPHWPALRPWLVSYLRAELRERFTPAAVAAPSKGAQR